MGDGLHDRGILVGRKRTVRLSVRKGASLCGNKARFAVVADSAWGEAALES